MSIKFTNLFILLLIVIASSGQEISTTYYKSNGEQTKKVDKAEYVEKILKIGDLFSVKKYLIENDKIILDSELKSLDPYIEDGVTTYYDNELFDFVAKGSYKNGIIDSIWIYKGVDNKYDTVDYSIVKNSIHSSIISNDKETFVIAEQMPCYKHMGDLIKRRILLDQQIQQLLVSKQDNKTDNDKYLLLHKQIIDLNRIAIDNYLKDNLCYPQRAKKKGIEGTVYVQFVINEMGKVVDVKVIRGIDKDLDLEAIRSIYSMADWTAGKQNGQSVRVAMAVGVKFEL